MLWKLSELQPIITSAIPGDTVPAAFWNAVQARGDKIALRQKHLGIWREVTWREFGAAVRETAMGLAALGLQPGDVVSILSNTRKEWLFADLGALCSGLVTSGIYPTDAAAQCEYLCSDSRTRMVFVEDDEQLDKILEIRNRLPALTKIVIIDLDGLGRFSDPQAISLDALRELGREYDCSHPGEFERRLDARAPGDLAILVYTSGTTGKPKGAMLSHRNLVTQWPVLNKAVAQNERDTRMAFLPLCHIVERQFGAYFAMYTGTVLNFVENPETVPENVREISPTVMLAVPRVWEKFYSAVVIALSEAVRPHQWLYHWAIAQGHAVADHVLAGRPVPPLLKLRYRLARWLAIDNLRKLIGIHRCRFLMTGSAPIAPDLIRWYLALGVPMLEGWGQTESTAMGTLNPPAAMRLGTIGKPLEGVEVRLSAEGELLLRGDFVFMGYLNLPDKTAETIDADGARGYDLPHALAQHRPLGLCRVQHRPGRGGVPEGEQHAVADGWRRRGCAGDRRVAGRPEELDGRVLDLCSGRRRSYGQVCSCIPVERNRLSSARGQHRLGFGAHSSDRGPLHGAQAGLT